MRSLMGHLAKSGMITKLELLGYEDDALDMVPFFGIAYCQTIRSTPKKFAARFAFGCQRLTGIGNRLSGNLNMGKQEINLSARFCRIFSGHIMHFY
jgi:hypothetical protein